MTTNTITLATDDTTAMALVATIKASVNGAGKYAAFVTAHNVTRETVADNARALAVLTYPNDAPVQKKDGTRTRFGNAVQAAGRGLRDALGKAESSDDEKTVNLLTVAGKAATLEEITAAWTAAQGEK